MAEVFDERAKQRLRLRRSLLALAGAVIFAHLLLASHLLGFFRGNDTQFIVLISCILGGAMVTPLLILGGYNLRFPDPSLTIPQIVIATAITFTSIYFLDQLRAVFLMVYLTVMIFAAFRLKLAGFLFITAMALTCYGMVIMLLLHYHPQVIDLKAEMVRWAGFALTLGGFSLSGSDLSELRRRVSSQNKELSAALMTIKQQAITDELTGAFNRRHILEILKYQKNLAERGKYSFVVCYADLDHFKRINDHFGHNVGDLVLQKFAHLTKEAIREVDFVARFGGEEFLLVLVDTTLENAAKAMERVRQGIQDFSFGDMAPGLGITVSLGVTPYHDGESIDKLISRADEALYQAKKDGRNRVVVKP
ncbi:MAG: GGDEF domain-containing protein [Desulfarculus sp.]|nr:GGDEF domain-containing protein [Desulfarculus sp.]